MSELEIPLPDLGTRLHDLEHPLVVKAQAIANDEAVGRAERIRALTDRRWFKVKTRTFRGAAGDVSGSLDEESNAKLRDYECEWWLVRGGTRQDDSPQHDFYARLDAAAHRGGPNTCSTDFLLPTAWDVMRIDAEAALNAKRLLQRVVRVMAARSLQTGDTSSFELGCVACRSLSLVQVRIDVSDLHPVRLPARGTRSCGSPWKWFAHRLPGTRSGDFPVRFGRAHFPRGTPSVSTATTATHGRTSGMTLSAAADRFESGSGRLVNPITGFARRSFASLSREQAQAVLQERPDPVSAVRRPGPDPYHVLLFGAGVLTGVGLTDHDHGLPGRIADELVARRARGVHIDIVVNPHSTAPAALGLLGGLRLRRYDAIVMVVGEQEATQLAPAQWRGALVGLTKLLITETCPSAGLFIFDSVRAMAPVSTVRVGAAAERLIPVTEEVCQFVPRMRFDEFPPSVLSADPVRGFSDGTYRDWAGWVVDRLEPALAAVDDAVDEDTPKRFRNRPQDERLRQRAVDSLRLRFGERDERLDKELLKAKQRYGAGSAFLTIVDLDVTWTRGTTDADVTTLDRWQSFCDLGVRSDGLLLINDTWRDPRTRTNPLAEGPGAIRFYAGYPVRTWDGYRVGMLCVHGPTPRTFTMRNMEELREIAARVEGILRRDALHVRLR